MITFPIKIKRKPVPPGPIPPEPVDKFVKEISFTEGSGVSGDYYAALTDNLFDIGLIPKEYDESQVNDYEMSIEGLEFNHLIEPGDIYWEEPIYADIDGMRAIGRNTWHGESTSAIQILIFDKPAGEITIDEEGTTIAQALSIPENTQTLVELLNSTQFETVEGNFTLVIKKK